MIGLQAAERFFEHPHGNLFVATMGADFGHHERLIPLASQRFAEALFAESVVILPCIVEKPDAVVASRASPRWWQPKPRAEIFASARPNFRKGMVPLETWGTLSPRTADCVGCNCGTVG